LQGNIPARSSYLNDIDNYDILFRRFPLLFVLQKFELPLKNAEKE